MRTTAHCLYTAKKERNSFHGRDLVESNWPHKFTEGSVTNAATKELSSGTLKVVP